LGKATDTFLFEVKLLRTIIEKVGDLWARRIELANPRKTRRLEEFYTVFDSVVRSWLDGKVWSEEQIIESEYFKYLRGYHSWWKTEPLSERAKREILERWREGEELLWDIKRRGMRDPIEVITGDRGRQYIRRGNRRLVILWVLGISKAKICYGTIKEWKKK
jgi:hypothetical protein